MNLLPSMLLAVTSTVAMHLPLNVDKELYPLTMCEEVMVELLSAVERGYIDSKDAEEIGGRCYQRYGEVNTNK